MMSRIIFYVDGKNLSFVNGGRLWLRLWSELGQRFPFVSGKIAWIREVAIEKT